jgi:hypothetical protein
LVTFQGNTGSAVPAPTAEPDAFGGVDVDDEEEMMRRAIEMSMREFDEQTRPAVAAEPEAATAAEPAMNIDAVSCPSRFSSYHLFILFPIINCL